MDNIRVLLIMNVDNIFRYTALSDHSCMLEAYNVVTKVQEASACGPINLHLCFVYASPSYVLHSHTTHL